MSVRFQYAGDKDISAGRSGGASIFSLPLAGGFPAAGTYYDTQYGVEYPIAQGGAYLTNPVDSSQVPNQVCDVDREHDGSGGIVYDWTTATNVVYKSAGTHFYTDPLFATSAYPVEVPTGSGYYADSGVSFRTYEHDGMGTWQYGADVFGYYHPYPTVIIPEIIYQTEVPWMSGQFYDNGLVSNYVWNGSGGYTTATSGAYYNSGIYITQINNSTEVPSLSGQYYNDGTANEYTWNGSGGYTETLVGSYYSYGTFIYNDGIYDYYWDGNGGYYY